MGTETHAISYKSVPVEPYSCTMKEYDLHLKAFIEDFLEADVRGRWQPLLTRRRASWFVPPNNIKLGGQCYGPLFDWFSPKDEYSKLAIGEEAYPSALAGLYGAARGVYFDGFMACKVTAAEGASVTIDHHRNGILSFVPGRKAIFFDQDLESGIKGAWLLDRKMGS